MKKYFLILAISILAFTSCRNDNITNYKSASTFTFPNTIGNHWHYKYSEGGKAISYIDVDIIGQGKLPDGQNAKIWVYKILNYTDTTYVVSDNSLVKIYDEPCWPCTTQMPYERQRYLLPLKTGNIWFSNASYGDTTKVITQSSLTVPAGTFENTYELSKTRGYVTNSSTSNRIWLTPNVGLTKLEQSEINLGPVLGNGIWELDNYSLK